MIYFDHLVAVIIFSPSLKVIFFAGLSSL